jgi:hypothetical protein
LDVSLSSSSRSAPTSTLLMPYLRIGLNRIGVPLHTRRESKRAGEEPTIPPAVDRGTRIASFGFLSWAFTKTSGAREDLWNWVWMPASAARKSFSVWI